MRDPRPDFTKAVDKLLQAIPRHVPELSHVRAPSVLVVAGAARDRSRATVRSLTVPGHPRVVVDGHRRLTEITLRPLFFLEANGLGRLVTLFHELFHLDPAGDGALAEDRRHTAARGRFDGQVEALARAFVQVVPPRLLEPLAHEGEVLCRQWRLRPAPGGQPARFGNAQLFLGPVPMHTPRGERAGWW